MRSSALLQAFPDQRSQPPAEASASQHMHRLHWMLHRHHPAVTVMSGQWPPHLHQSRPRVNRAVTVMSGHPLSQLAPVADAQCLAQRPVALLPLPLSDPPLVAVSVPLGQQLGGHCAPQLLRHVPRKLHGADLGGGSEWKDRGQGEELAAEGYRTHITCMQGHAWHAPRSRRARGGSREWLESAGDAAVKILQSANGAITESARTTGRGTQE